ncbi:unnamed protein product [Scytosiphon promiscuus]
MLLRRWVLPCHTTVLALLTTGLAPSMAFVGCNQRAAAIVGNAMSCRGAAAAAAAAGTSAASEEVHGGSDASQSSLCTLAKMERWFDDIGVDRGGGLTAPSAVRLGRFPGRGIGLEAAVELERDSTVASIPRRACLSSDPADAPAGTLRARAHSIVASIPLTAVPSRFEEDTAFERDVAVVTLQVFLESAAGARSSFAPWMAALSLRGELNLPALWPPKDLRALKGTLVLEEVERCLAKAEVERDAVAAALAGGVGCAAAGNGEKVVANEASRNSEHRWLDMEDMGKRLTRAEWLHARCTVQSRAYRVGSRYLLIPLVDFANHYDDIAFSVCAGDGVFTGADEVVFVADRSYEPGQEVCTSYGADMDNAKRLFSFGFITLHPPPERLPRSSSKEASFPLPTEAFCDVFFTVASMDVLRTLKEDVLEEFGRQAGDGGFARKRSAMFPLTPRRQSVSQLLEGPVRSFVESVLPALRLVAMTPDQLNHEVTPSTAASVSGSDRIVRGVLGHQVDAFRGPRAVQSGQILERLGRCLSPENERDALRLLEEQCSAHLEAIDLTSSDVDALKEAVSESCEAGAFTASGPRSLLAATVRVGEAIAWGSLREACTGRTYGRDGVREEKTWFAWVLELCVRSHPN